MFLSRKRSVAFVVALAGVALAQPVMAQVAQATSAPAAEGVTAPIKVDLRVDANRDGVVDVKGNSDVPGKKSATVKAGALFLPNIDDDGKRCKMTDAKGKALPRPALLACNDAQDNVVNGNADAADLARVHALPIPSLSDKASVNLRPVGKGAAFVRMFYVDGPAWKPLPATGVLPARLAKRGLMLGLEGKTVAANKAVWDGTVTIGMTVKDGANTGSDSVMMRQAPLTMFPHTRAATSVATTSFGNTGYEGRLKAAVNKVSPKSPFTIVKSEKEPWAQDMFEPMSAAMPQGKGLQSMTINVIPGVERTEMMAYFTLRGVNVGFFQVGNPNRKFDDKSVDYMGNVEVLPPHQGFPLGRVVLGDWTTNPKKKVMVDPAMRAFFAAQEVQGPPLSVDAGWLSVGHIDEFFTTVPAKNALGWKLVVADPTGGRELIKQMQAKGLGKQSLSRNTEMFTMPVDEYFDDKNTKHSALAQDRINAGVAAIKAATGLTDADVVKVPVVYTYDAELDPQTGEAPKPALPGGLFTLKASLPNAVNSLILGDKAVVSQQFARLAGGVDLFEQAVTAAYGKVGITPTYVDDVMAAHIAGGNVHCTTATAREHIAWWKSIK